MERDSVAVRTAFPPSKEGFTAVLFEKEKKKTTFMYLGMSAITQQ